MDQSQCSTTDLQGAFDALTIQCVSTEPDPIPAELSRKTVLSEKQKLIQQHLIYLLHADRCNQRRPQTNGAAWPCTAPHCQSMADVLDHLKICKAGSSCLVEYCNTARQIINHWKRCTAECPICIPLKRPGWTRVNPYTTTDPQINHSQNTSATDMRRTYDDTLGIQCSFTGLGKTSAELIPNQITTSLQQSDNSLMSVVPSEPEGASQSLYTHLLGGSQAQQSIAWTKELHYPVPPAMYETPDSLVLPDQKKKEHILPYARKVKGVVYKRAASSTKFCRCLASKSYAIRRDIEKMRQKMKKRQEQVAARSLQLSNNSLISDVTNRAEAAYPSLYGPLSVGLQAGQPVAETKEWHRFISADVRNHFLYLLRKGIPPPLDLQTLPNNKMNNFEEYVRQEERNIYEMANSKTEYYQLLEERVYRN